MKGVEAMSRSAREEHVIVRQIISSGPIIHSIRRVAPILLPKIE